MGRGIRAGAVAAVASGLPSTAYALASGRDPLEATLAAGSIVLPNEHRRNVLLAAAVPVHFAISIGWAVALDRGVIGRRYPRMRALPFVPQLADHVAYGAIVGALLSPASPSRA